MGPHYNAISALGQRSRLTGADRVGGRQSRPLTMGLAESWLTRAQWARRTVGWAR